jgi:hypothetical protein
MCPACSSPAVFLLDARWRSDGTHWRRQGCRACHHRWSTWQHKQEMRGPLKPRACKAPQKPLTKKQVKQILLDQRSHHELGRLMNRSPEGIRKLRIGVTHAGVHPEIPRWPSPVTPPPVTDGESCYLCQHWAERCTFGYPDPIEEGPAFARDCAMYDPR